METQTVYAIFLIIGVACAIILREVAEERGANQKFWFVFGLILGPIGLFFIPLIKRPHAKR